MISNNGSGGSVKKDEWVVDIKIIVNFGGKEIIIYKSLYGYYLRIWKE